MHAHRDRGDATEAARLLHTLKGLAATLGATALARQVASAEGELAGASGADRLAVAVQAVDDHLATLRPRLDAWRAALDRAAAAAAPVAAPAATAEGGSEGLAEPLRQLARLLRDSDMDAMPALEALRRDHAAALGSHLDALEQAVDGLDFARAAALCDDLLQEVQR